MDILKIDSTDYYALSNLAKLEYAAGNNDIGTDYLTRAFASNKEEALKNSEGLLAYLESKHLAEANKAASAVVESYRKAAK